MWLIFVIPFIMFFVIFLMIAISIFKGHKQSKDTMQSMIETISQRAQEQVDKSFSSEPEKTCEYCGSKVSASSSKCAGCGARIKRK